MVKSVPSYVKLWESGELARRAQAARMRLSYCDLCPRQCHVDRLGGVLGVCHTGAQAIVHSWGPHHGEEAPLVGQGGSGTLFFSCCNLNCLYCQNFEISQLGYGRPMSAEELADGMLQMQTMGCHNVNLVSPTHVVAQILEALVIASERGLRLPLVYNTGGYDGLSTLALLDGVIDVYLPDAKYASDQVAQRFSGVSDYVAVSRAALREMHRQVGELVVDDDGIARRGLLVRHLVLPDRLAGTKEIMAFLAGELSPQTYVNIMPQYTPAYRAQELDPVMSRRLTQKEYEDAVQAALDAGLTRLDHLEAKRRQPRRPRRARR